jgi:hypothetical protein
MTEPATGLELMSEYESGMADYVLEVSKNRKAAQDNLMQTYSGIALNRVEAHAYFMDTNFTGAGASLPENIKQFINNARMEYGYNLRFNGFGFDGYIMGPMLIGGARGVAIARSKGSLLAEGLLADESIAGARQYCSHLFSYVEYDLGPVKVKAINLGSSDSVMEYDPPDWDTRPGWL